MGVDSFTPRRAKWDKKAEAGQTPSHWSLDCHLYPWTSAFLALRLYKSDQASPSPHPAPILRPLDPNRTRFPHSPNCRQQIGGHTTSMTIWTDSCNKSPYIYVCVYTHIFRCLTSSEFTSPSNCHKLKYCQLKLHGIYPTNLTS